MVFKKGHKVPEEWRKKISIANKGCLPWNKGIPCAEEVRKKIMLTSKGKHYSLETEFKKGEVSNENNANWKGGKVSYYRKEARKTLEKKYKVKWEDMFKPKDAVIHHINKNWKDNRFENLCVMSQSDHLRLHCEQGDYFGR